MTEDPGAFDAPFFSITAKEAASMSPRQRQALEVAYHTFESGRQHLHRINSGIAYLQLAHHSFSWYAS